MKDARLLPNHNWINFFCQPSRSISDQQGLSSAAIGSASAVYLPFGRPTTKSISSLGMNLFQDAASLRASKEAHVPLDLIILTLSYHSYLFCYSLWRAFLKLGLRHWRNPCTPGSNTFGQKMIESSLGRILSVLKRGSSFCKKMYQPKSSTKEDTHCQLSSNLSPLLFFGNQPLGCSLGIILAKSSTS